MSQTDVHRGRAERFAGVLISLLGLSLALVTDPAWGDESAPPLAADAPIESGPDPRSSGAQGPNLGAAAGEPGEGPGTSDLAKTNVETEVRYNGTPTAGSRITLGLNGSADPETTYRWVQIEGPPVAIEDPTRPLIRLTIPPDAQRLGFLLILRDGRGEERRARVIIPVQPEADRSPGAGPRADAGDDQIGLVGRRITLNGSRSTPHDEAGYRWFQVSGPKIDQPTQDGHFYSFIPTASGHYRFGLIVAVGSVLSEPDEVVVAVGEYPSTSGFNPLGPLGVVTDQIAEVFEAIAERTALYSSFADLSSEMTRRLDVVVPQDPQLRQLWAQGVFAPLSQHTASELLAVGLDLRVAQGHQQALTPLQREKLRRLFSTYALQFRSRMPSR